MDTLTKWYSEKVTEDMDNFQIFQAGVTAGAVSMRERAVKVAQDNDDKNEIINKVGELSDIPTEA